MMLRLIQRKKQIKIQNAQVEKNQLRGRFLKRKKEMEKMMEMISLNAKTNPNQLAKMVNPLSVLIRKARR